MFMNTTVYYISCNCAIIKSVVKDVIIDSIIRFRFISISKNVVICNQNSNIYHFNLFGLPILELLNIHLFIN